MSLASSCKELSPPALSAQEILQEIQQIHQIDPRTASREAIEGAVRKEAQSVMRVGMMLLQLKTRHLWRQSHKTWEEYCDEVLPFGRRRADQLILAELEPERETSRPAPSGGSASVAPQPDYDHQQEQDEFPGETILAPSTVPVRSREERTDTDDESVEEDPDGDCTQARRSMGVVVRWFKAKGKYDRFRVVIDAILEEIR